MSIRRMMGGRWDCLLAKRYDMGSSFGVMIDRAQWAMRLSGVSSPSPEEEQHDK
jgi:hypothetical protein